MRSPEKDNRELTPDFAWRIVAEVTVVYADRGISRGMTFGIGGRRGVRDSRLNIEH